MKRFIFLFSTVLAIFFTSCVMVVPEKAYVTIHNSSRCDCERITRISFQKQNGTEIASFNMNISDADSDFITVEPGIYSAKITVRGNNFCTICDSSCTCKNKFYPETYTTSYENFAADKYYQLKYDGAGLKYTELN